MSRPTSAWGRQARWGDVRGVGLAEGPDEGEDQHNQQHNPQEAHAATTSGMTSPG